jgi:hypothetical protein
MIDFGPPFATRSRILGVGGSQQVGFAEYPGPAGTSTQAILWLGTSESRVFLTPGNAIGAVAVATNGTQQVGAVDYGNRYVAAIWSGTAESFIDLGGLLGFSEADAITDTIQAGWGAPSVGGVTARLWHGTAASQISLHPASATGESRVIAASGDVQVGFVDSRASLWRGTAASWVNLNAFLPAGRFAGASAKGVWTDGRATFVAGVAQRIGSSDLYDAVLWTQICPGAACPTDFDCSGGLGENDIVEFTNAWFAADLRADFDGVGGLTINDIFAFLNAWFAGC